MTILILLAVAVWLMLCAFVVALARTAARGDAQRRLPAERRFVRTGAERGSSRNPD